ncbi:MAG: PqqD family peptide modification chaperone [Verrucomicrobiota bacterium]
MNDLLDAKLSLNEQFVWEPMPDGCILYCQDSGQIITLNPTAELILSYCDGATSLREVYHAMTQETPIAEDVFFSTVQRFLDEKVLLPATS